jgi:RecA-family ATPase
LFVVEVDTPEGHKVDGVAALRKLEAQYGKLPVTMMQKSPTGSIHYFFRYPGNKVWQSASRIALGIDVRGDGGMVILPPSKRDDGKYTWVDEDQIEIAEAPTWLLKLVTVQQSGMVVDDDDEGDPFEQLIREQPPPPLDVDELLDEMQYPGNVHETELRVSASLLSRKEPADAVVTLLLRELADRIPESRRWDWTLERYNIRTCCVDWFKKNPELLQYQGELPKWLRKKLNGHAPAELSNDKPEIEYLKGSQLDGEPIEAPTWIVLDLILEGALNGFFGDGATGKDLLMLQLAYAMTHDKPFLGMKVKQGRVIYLNTEDSKRHMRFRASKIMAYFDLKQTSDDLMILPLRGKKNHLLAKVDRSGLVAPTALYHSLCKLIEEFKPTLVITANRVNIFSVNQNDDVQARQCVTLLDAIAETYNTTVIMLAHPSLGQLQTGSGSSGSVQWSNGCRQRLYLSRPKKNEGDDKPPTENERKTRILEVLKSNWGPQGNGIKLQWIDWYFKAENEDLGIDESAFQESVMLNAEQEFLRMIEVAEQSDIFVSQQPTARNNAASLFAKHPAFSKCRFRGKSGYDLLMQAMTNLFEKGDLKTIPYGAPSRGFFRVVKAD